MSFISEYINQVNNQKKNALAVFLTAGFPDPENFAELSINILNAGADILEIGIPFSDPIADGPVIQKSSKASLDISIHLEKVLEYSKQIKQQVDKPIVLMGYANPVLNYGLTKFIKDANDCKVDGVIIPDIPLEEYESFWNVNNNGIDRILLTTPTSSIERINKIDQKSEGFIYCVSVTGTTGSTKTFDNSTLENIKNTYSMLKKNKMLIGFGISNPDDIKKFTPYCDGVIVGSAIIKQLIQDKIPGFKNTLEFVENLSRACKFD